MELVMVIAQMLLLILIAVNFIRDIRDGWKSRKEERRKRKDAAWREMDSYQCKVLHDGYGESAPDASTPNPTASHGSLHFVGSTDNLYGFDGDEFCHFDRETNNLYDAGGGESFHYDKETGNAYGMGTDTFLHYDKDTHMLYNLTTGEAHPVDEESGNIN